MDVPQSPPTHQVGHFTTVSGSPIPPWLVLEEEGGAREGGQYLLHACML